MLNVVFKKADEIIHYARSRLYAANHEKFRVELRIINAISRISDKLCKKHTLCTPIAIPKRVKKIKRIIQIRYFYDKFIFG